MNNDLTWHSAVQVKFYPDSEKLTISLPTLRRAAVKALERAFDLQIASLEKRPRKKYLETIHNVIKTGKNFEEGLLPTVAEAQRIASLANQSQQLAQEARFGDNQYDQLVGVQDVAGSAASIMLSILALTFVGEENKLEAETKARSCYTDAISLGVSIESDWEKEVSG